jgi:hypothetical protein
MKYQNIIIYVVIPLALLSIPSLLENVQAQSDSANQTTAPQQQNQNMSLTAQALMKIDIFEIKDTLMQAELAVVDGNLEEALTGVRDVESQLLQIEPSPTKFLSVIHKAIKAIADSDIDKALDTLTRIQVNLFKAENQIFKAAVANPQIMQQFDTMKPNTNEEEDYTDIEDYTDTMQQFNNAEPNINAEDYTDVEDS